MPDETNTVKAPVASIIMPAYNVEAYIQEALECLHIQTMKDFEVLVIDDGSTDSTPQIVRSFVEVDGRFQLFRIENGGPSKARNYAISLASGKYYLFVDSDDLVAPDYVETLVTLLEEHDCQCSACGIAVYKGNTTRANNSSKVKIYSNDEVTYCMFDKPRGFLFNKVFLASLIADNNLRLREDIRQSEDMLFLLDYLSCCEKVAYVGDIKYLYRQRRDSLTNSMVNSRWFDIIKVFEEFRARLHNNPSAVAAVRKNFLLVACEAKYRYKTNKCNNHALKNKIRDMYTYSKEAMVQSTPLFFIKVLVYKYCFPLVQIRRSGNLS